MENPNPLILSPAVWATVEPQLIDLLQKKKSRIMVRVESILIDIARQSLVIKPNLSYEKDGKQVVLPIAGMPLIVITPNELSQKPEVLKLLTELLDTSTTLTLENLIANEVFGLTSPEAYIKL